MPPHAKHRRPKGHAFRRRILAAGTGLALPVVLVGAAGAAPSSKPASSGAGAATAAHRPAAAHPARTASGSTAKPAAAKRPAAGTAPAAKAKSRPTSHVVRKGETLEGIARKTGVSAARLYESNKRRIGPNRHSLPAGLVLVVPMNPGKMLAARHDRTQSPPSASGHANNLDGWIREALAIMQAHGIPGTYEGIRSNILRESSGNPNAVNTWDINAVNGTPSKGLLQVIQPTFDAYHVASTPRDILNPVSNIVAACNYAYHRYGSINNVSSAY
ncbi:LysM peptidoglycan-binding domain-containing protein [Streptomyces bambusae]|uniref:LysM peptidoglycan-binding domain-containing protein n=1 Tax=Streptomyces bambusae TaxID=1550616 RepID=UPI001CFE5265|nr:LysM peptidoglycan-binding domain-containing protein [Streptomyces bambusae]MCB5164617.1 LysM peptidoglycan-binding domain-containing protein [Streptomyces bambusae]